ncbi:hypothetical protein KCU98_g44, partial [Aureobasidium melanogenum]
LLIAAFVFAAISAMLRSPLMSILLAALYCSSSQISRKKTSSLQSRIAFSRYSAEPKTRQRWSIPFTPASSACSSLVTP